MCLEERPREKLIAKGARSLSSGELLAVLLRTGHGGKNALEAAQELLGTAEGRLQLLGAMSVERLCRVGGVGPDKAATVVAAFELGRRWAAERTDLAKVPIRSAALAHAVMSPRLRGLDHEEFWVMFLNRANYVIGQELISIGTMTSTSVDTARILKRLLEKNATGVIMFHNHPSGNPRPGTNDIEATIAVKEALETMDRHLLDHIIVADGCYYSFEEGEVSASSDDDL